MMSVRRPKSVGEVWSGAAAVFDGLLRNTDREILRTIYAATYTDIFNLMEANSECGKEIYVRSSALLKSYLAELVEAARSVPDRELLMFFVKKWQDFCKSTQLINSMLSPVNRKYVKEAKTNGEDVYEVLYLADFLWKEAMFMPLRARLKGAMLSLIKLDRDGHEINTGLIAEVIPCLIRLGVNKQIPNRPSLEFYKTCFENDFLKAFDVAYASELVDANDDFCARMQVVEARLALETLRLRQLRAHHTTEQRLADIVVKHHVAAIYAHTAHLLEEMQQADLARMYALLTRLGAVGLDPMRAAFESHVISFGRNAIAAAAPEEPGALVAALVRVFRTHHALVREVFLDDPSFVAALDKAFRELLNNNDLIINDNNAVMQAEQIVPRVPQLLAKYCDMIMRKGPKHIADEAEMERTLDDVVSLVKYVPDKDVFMLVYKMLLAKRFIGDSSGNADFEAAMINKLKAAHGFEYTSSLRCMVQDVAISKDINTAFKEWCEQNDEEVALDLSISVLATGTWPLQSRPTQFVVPQALVGPMDLFKTFYTTKYSGRKLTYLHHLGKVVVQVTYALEGRLRVLATTFQLAILAHFDTAGTDQLTLGDIASATLLQERDIKIALLGMLKRKFIRCAAGPKHSTWNESTTFALVKNFKSARIRILLDVPVAADGLKSAALAQVEAREMRCEREFRLRAAIVRVMKARQTITHQQLISEAIRSVHKWFTPTVALIEYLIESEYIAIDETNLELVSYSYRA